MRSGTLTVIFYVTFAAGILTGLLAAYSHRRWPAILVAGIFGAILRFVADRLVRE
jgi:integral membrane sensor domain MASE1